MSSCLLGCKIYLQSEYLLESKAHKGWYAGMRGMHSYVCREDAVVFTGSQLANMPYNWRTDFTAQEVK